MRQLTPLDAQFLAVESSRTYGHVGGLAVYDPSTAPGGALGLPEICELVAERLHLLPPFRRRLVQVPLGLDLPYWAEDEDFDLDFHVRESAVPPPGTDRQLADTVARIFARPLDRSRPLWELYLIQGLERGRVALLTKVHHSVVDGVSGNEILSVLLDPTPEGREIEPPKECGPGGRRPGELEMLGRGLAGLARQPLRALRSVPTALPNLTELPGANAFPGVPALSRVLSGARRALGGPQDPGIGEIAGARPPRTCFNGPISAHRGFAFGSVSLDTVKAIKNAAGVKVNDVVVAVCAGAVREWLLERDELPDEPLVAMIPVSVRAEDEMGTFGNRISTMIVPIPTDVADPKRRLERAHELLRRGKEHHAALPADLLTDASSFIPPAVAALAARTVVGILGRTRPPLNLVISNVPGPRSPLYIAGARLEAHYPVSAVVDGVGLNMTVMSYLDHVDFGIVSDRDQIADVWPLLRAAQRAVDELEAEVCQRPAAPASVASGA
jgi:diacylglycerol O-acyltransferase / wax synthase